MKAFIYLFSLIALVACAEVVTTEKLEAAPRPEATGVTLTTAELQRINITRTYETGCANCHGAEGEGGGAGTRTFLTAELFDQRLDRRFYNAIKDGVPDMGMVAHSYTLAPEVMWGLVVHIRELQARALNARAPRTQVDGPATRSQHERFTVRTIIPPGRGLSTPWSLDWLPDGRMIITNRPGDVFVADAQGRGLSEVEGLPQSVEIGQGGRMEVAVHPTNGFVYMSFNDPGPNNRGGMTKIVRGRIRVQGNRARWTDQQTIFEAAPNTYTGSGLHFGSKIAFDNRGHVFFTIGDRGQQDRAQDLGQPNGKVFRVREDGSIPADNPFVGRAGALSAVWSYGHRNSQGLAIDLNGNLWTTDHSVRGGDELNLIRRGENYGWPLYAFTINYNDTPFRTPWPAEGRDMTMPVYRWMPSTGTSGLDVARGAAFPRWRGDLLAGGLSGENVDRIRIHQGQVVERERIIFRAGRVRDIAVHRDGSVYLVMNGPDRVLRIAPVR